MALLVQLVSVAPLASVEVAFQKNSYFNCLQCSIVQSVYMVG